MPMSLVADTLVDTLMEISQAMIEMAPHLMQPVMLGVIRYQLERTFDLPEASRQEQVLVIREDARAFANSLRGVLPELAD